MAQQPNTDGQLLDALRAFRVAGTVSHAARNLGIPRETFRSRLESARRRWPTGIPVIAEKREEVTPPETTPPDHIAARREQQTIVDLRARLKGAEERAIRAEDERDQLRHLRTTALAPAEWTPAETKSGRPRLVPILFTSDFQCGEVIKPDEVDGLNAYNMDIFADRYHALIERTIDISDHHTGEAEFPGIVYLRGGDAISGGIHAELKDTDDLSAIPAVRYLMRHEMAGIRRLKERFGRVLVVSIPGNHGRTTFKPRAKGYVEHSFETLLTWWLASSFEGDPAVTFQHPASGDAFFETNGWKFLLAHGDRMGSRGGQGFVGPAATIARGHQKLYGNWAATGRAPDFILTGHLHTSLKLQRGYANGSLAGYGEYARDIQALPDGAKQWLFFVHRRRGVSQAFEVQVSDRPRRVITDTIE